jgi:hypothetical protein
MEGYAPLSKSLVGAYRANVRVFENGSQAFEVLRIWGNRVPEIPIPNYDLNDDCHVDEEDFELMVEDLAAHGTRKSFSGDSESNESSQRFDVNGDGFISPRDALAIANAIHRSQRIERFPFDHCYRLVDGDMIADIAASFELSSK